MYVSVYMSVCVCECVYECVCMCVCECECMRACMCACSQTTYEQTDPTENNSYTSILYAAVTNPINTGDSQREGRPGEAGDYSTEDSSQTRKWSTVTRTLIVNQTHMPASGPQIKPTLTLTLTLTVE